MGIPPQVICIFFFHLAGQDDFSIVTRSQRLGSCFMIAINNDDIFENIETFSLSLTIDTNHLFGIRLQPNSTEITIIDDDGNILCHF